MQARSNGTKRPAMLDYEADCNKSVSGCVCKTCLFVGVTSDILGNILICSHTDANTASLYHRHMNKINTQGLLLLLSIMNVMINCMHCLSWIFFLTRTHTVSAQKWKKNRNKLLLNRERTKF